MKSNLRAGSALVFLVNPTGAILQPADRGGAGALYDGVGAGPNFEAAFQAAGDMSGEIAIPVPVVDGNVRVPAQ